MPHPVLAYHERSKHHLDRYAPGPGGLDWATQPEPFRRYQGAPSIDLPILADDPPTTWDDLFGAERPPAWPLDLASLARLLQLSLGLSAWKSQGDSRWALRCNPSSGNLHPTEGYLIAPDLPGLPAGVYHYHPLDHRLERRAACADPAWRGGALLALSGIHWREAWKYGIRAFRYCQHDCGHAMAAVAYAAAALGWPVRWLEEWGDDDIAAVTGIGRAGDYAGAEAEAPEVMLWIGAGEPPSPPAARAALAAAEWRGLANRLSPAHRDWPDIPLVAAASRKPAGTASSMHPAAPLPPLAPVSREPVSALIRRRRSAQAFDGAGGIGAAALFRMLDALQPRAGQPPWSLLAAPPRVHAVLFLHRVHGLEAGLYGLPREDSALAELRAEMRPDWLWARVPGCPAHVPLYLLAPLDARQFAATASCHQAIAADSAFSLAMLADFSGLEHQPWNYRARFQEAGMLGHALYLEAEAAGVQGTGIGCYFDDAVHQALGLKSARFQDIYHFTVGHALLDARLASAPPYAHLDAARAGADNAGAR